MIIEFINSFMTLNGYFPRYHCLAGDDMLVWLLSASHIITVFEYWFIAFCAFNIARWGKAKGHWRGIFDSLGCVLVWCSFNSIMFVLVTYYPLYWFQAATSWIAVLVSLRCIYHISMLHKGAIREFAKAIKMTVQSSGL